MPFCVFRKNDGTVCSRKITDDDVESVSLGEKKGYVCGPCIADLLAVKPWTTDAPYRHSLKRRSPTRRRPTDEEFDDFEDDVAT